MRNKEIEHARNILKKNGYFTDNLWSNKDVQTVYNLSNKESQIVLSKALQNEYVVENIFNSIDYYAKEIVSLKNE